MQEVSLELYRDFSDLDKPEPRFGLTDVEFGLSMSHLPLLCKMVTVQASEV